MGVVDDVDADAVAGWRIAAIGLDRDKNEHQPDYLLLQFDSDALLGASFGDGGRLHIWMSATSTIAGRIDGCLVDIDSF